MTTLSGRRVLIVGDDPVIGAELARAFATLGAVVLGPTPCLWRAGILARAAEAAVMDIRADTAAAQPLADRLRRRGIPVVFLTACDEAAPPAHVRDAARLSHAAAPGSAILLGPARPPAPPEDAIEILPKLRLIARVMIHDAIAADRLVENTLKAALDEIEARDALQPLDDWLVALLQRQGSRHGIRLMN